MANDRLIIVCDTCGGWKTLVKYSPGGSDYIPESGGWIALHLMHCHPFAFCNDLKGVTGFHLITESSEELDTSVNFEKQNMLPPDPIK